MLAEAFARKLSTTINKENFGKAVKRAKRFFFSPTPSLLFLRFWIFFFRVCSLQVVLCKWLKLQPRQLKAI